MPTEIAEAHNVVRGTGIEYGALAQLVAHNTGSVGVRSSNLLCSTDVEVLEIQDFHILCLAKCQNKDNFLTD